jgi:hypothetical protein
MVAGFLFSVILTLYGTVLKLSISDKKALAWGVSFLNSLLMSIVGVFYFFKTITLYPQFLSFEANGKIVYEQVDDVCNLICVWFAVANTFDLVFGLVFYRERLGFLTTYIHHPAFVWASITFVSGNAFLFKATPSPGGFALCMLEEIPTFLLALGSVYPRYRTDIGFGVTFFLLRICFHGYVFAYAVYSQIHIFPITILFLSSILHILWFGNWCNTYGRRLYTPHKDN